MGEPKVDTKLSEIDTLIKAEAAKGALGDIISSTPGEGSAASRAEEVGVKVNKAMEAFLGGAGGEIQGGKQVLRREELGEEEERLLQMASAVFPAAALFTCFLICVSSLRGDVQATNANDEVCFRLRTQMFTAGTHSVVRVVYASCFVVAAATGVLMLGRLTACALLGIITWTPSRGV